jgi:hypothetical protein
MRGAATAQPAQDRGRGEPEGECSQDVFGGHLRLPFFASNTNRVALGAARKSMTGATRGPGATTTANPPDAFLVNIRRIGILRVGDSRE